VAFRSSCAMTHTQHNTTKYVCRYGSVIMSSQKFAEVRRVAGVLLVVVCSVVLLDSSVWVKTASETGFCAAGNAMLLCVCNYSVKIDPK
jgi:hypothetical protein